MRGVCVDVRRRCSHARELNEGRLFPRRSPNLLFEFPVVAKRVPPPRNKYCILNRNGRQEGVKNPSAKEAIPHPPYNLFPSVFPARPYGGLVRLLLKLCGLTSGIKIT